MLQTEGGEKILLGTQHLKPHVGEFVSLRCGNRDADGYLEEVTDEAATISFRGGKRIVRLDIIDSVRVHSPRV